MSLLEKYMKKKSNSKVDILEEERIAVIELLAQCRREGGEFDELALVEEIQQIEYNIKLELMEDQELKARIIAENEKTRLEERAEWQRRQSLPKIDWANFGRK